MHADTITTWSGLHPDTPHQCVSAQCGFRFSSASSSIRSLRSVIDLRRAGSLSHVVGDPGVVLLGMSRQIAPQTRSKSSQTHETGFRCPPGHGRREKRLQRLSGGQARRYLTRAFRSPGTAPAPAKPICTEQAAMRLVGGRRPSVL